MGVLKLEPACKEAIWGGRKLIEEYGKKYDGDNLAETWELSAHPDGASVVASGADAGMPLPSYIEKYGKSILGTNAARFADFPILIKFIDAKQNLSVQVHPDDAYALANEGQYGKTEMWYILEAEEGAKLYFGCKKEMTREEFAAHIADNTLEDVLNAVPVKKGDVFFIEAKTLHAIGAGIVLAEIQQNSNVTYRVYDYGRVGADGKPRELHTEKALDVADIRPPRTDYDFGTHIGVCDSFVVDHMALSDGSFTDEAGADSFVSLLVTDGAAKVACKGQMLEAKKGDSFFIEAGSGPYEVSGTADIVITKIPAAHG